MGDVKHYLRKMDFPDVVPEALSHMQKLWLTDGTTQQLSLMRELSQEFVFFEVDQWGHNREQKLPAIKELQVLERICWYFREGGPDSKLATFVFLFPYGSSILGKRLPFFNKLLSLAVAIGNSNVLSCIGIWMQLSGCSSQNSIYLAKSVCQEHFKSNVPLSNVINKLPKISPLFCASFTSSIATVYLAECPPKHIVEAILNWLKSEPSYCFEPLKIRIPNAFNFSGPQTPLPEIMHWVILSPFYKLMLESNSSNETLFSFLHFALLEVMIYGSKIQEVLSWEAIPIPKIQQIVDVLKNIQGPPANSMLISLERLAHCLEVGLTNCCIYPKSETLGELFINCIALPYHQLLKMVLQKWSYEVESGRATIVADKKMAIMSVK